MKTIQYSTRWLGLVLAGSTITLAASGQAGKPVKPPPEPPPPEGPAYQLIPVDAPGFSFFPDYSFNQANMISDSGALIGGAWYERPDGTGVRVPAVLPPRIVEGEVQYVADDIKRLLTEEGMAEFGTCFAMNESGFAVGAFFGDIDYSSAQAYLWLPDGTPIPLRVNVGGSNSLALDINNDGYVLLGENEPDVRGGVVVPLDRDHDGAPDTWFTDVDEDGINDLFFPIDARLNFNPLVINEAGQVLANIYPNGPGYLLTPDFSDEDEDGNPWFADVDPADGFNDLLVALDPPEEGASAVAVGLNNLGQVVGQSGGHVVRWEFVGDDQIITDLGALPKTYQMNVGGISDSGRVAGTCKIDLGRRSRLGPWWVIESDTLYELLPLAVNSDGWSDYIERYDVNHYYGINRYDWILGRALLNGSLRTFVAVPVEQP